MLPNLTKHELKKIGTAMRCKEDGLEAFYKFLEKAILKCAMDLVKSAPEKTEFMKGYVHGLDDLKYMLGWSSQNLTEMESGDLKKDKYVF